MRSEEWARLVWLQWGEVSFHEELEMERRAVYTYMNELGRGVRSS
jgi:hypothetical protein